MTGNIKQPSFHRKLSSATPHGRRVLIAGASGLIGGMLLRHLLADSSVAEVHALSRRSLTMQHPKLIAHLVDFAALPEFPPMDEAYLALGTTIKQAGSQAAFRAVDFDASLAVARQAIAAGAKRIGLVSAHGASPDASLFYTRIKGELEEALTLLAPTTLVIVRPSLLLGNRANLGQPVRYGERISQCLSSSAAAYLTCKSSAGSGQ